jgi:NhaA family Na+:H+ antiporter
VPTVLTQTYNAFFNSEKTGGLLLVACTAVALVVANSALGPGYLQFWHLSFGGLSVEHWVNDALMAVFFLLVGLELERELYNGELRDFKSVLLPISAAVGGIAVPALIHYGFNAGTSTKAGAGIPMATDIAFALGILALLGSRVPPSLKIFLTALAVIDDLGAVVVIAVFYAGSVSISFLLGSLCVFAALVLMNRALRVQALYPYLVGGVLMWFLTLKSGLHPTIAGVLLAFAIPFSPKSEDASSPSHRLEHALHKPVAFLILPLFALANTGVVVHPGWAHSLLDVNNLGIIAGLVVGKPLGILAACALAVALGFCRLPAQVGWRHIGGAGLLGGIGFTMSIFVTNLAFEGNPAVINASKMAVLVASSLAGILGFLWLRSAGRGRVY